MKVFKLLSLVLPSFCLSQTEIAEQYNDFAEKYSEIVVENNRDSLIAQKQPLTVWLRVTGEQAANRTPSYLQTLNQELNPFFDLEYLICTNEEDLFLSSFDPSLFPFTVKICTANMQSLSHTLNILIEKTNPSYPALFVSLGVNLTAIDLIQNFSWFQHGAWTIGWQINQIGNDGSLPGKGWYNTAALYGPTCLNWLKTHMYPCWIDTGMLGFVEVDGENLPIGGNEEIVLMANILRENREAYFVLNLKDPLDIQERTGTGVTFEEKMKRKIPVSKCYMEKLGVSKEDLWGSLLLIKPSKKISFAEE